MTAVVPASLHPSQSLLRAALWMVGAILSFSAMAVAGRMLGAGHDTFEIMLYRSLVGMVIIYALLTGLGRWHEVTRRHFGTQMVRNAAHFAGQNLWFFAVTMIPLAQVFALEFTSPLWVLVLSPLLLGERITQARAFAAGLGFFGILLVAQPFGAGGLNAGSLAAASAALGFAITILLTRKLTRSETVFCILFYITTTQALFGLICAGFDGQIALPTAKTWPLLVLVGCAGLLAHFCLTKALRLAPPTVTIPMDFTRLPLIAVVGWLVYDEVLPVETLLGAAIILLGNGVNLWAEARRK